MRKRLYEIIETASKGDRASAAYDTCMMAVIVSSLIPLAFKSTYPAFDFINSLSAYIFIGDYLLRLFTADLKLKRGTASFFLYPFTPHGHH